MRERAAGLLAAEGKGDLAADVTISTFHALGLKIIRGDAAAFGLKPGFSIFDPGDIEPIVADLLPTTDRARARAAQWRISAWKNALLSPAAARKAARCDDEGAAAEAYRRYDDTLRAYQAVDFDDLIALPIGLLAADAAVAAKWRERCGYLLVDEYQDINPAQYRLIRLLVGNAAFTVVGDDDQAIYGWRGASVDNPAALPKDFPALNVGSSSRTTDPPCASCARERADREQPKFREKAVERARAWRSDSRVPRPMTRPRPKASCAVSWRIVSSIAAVTSTMPFSIAATIRRKSSSKSCASRTCRTRSPVGNRISSAPRSRTSSRISA
jgi:superfamily I DNA/RNA helicase